MRNLIRVLDEKWCWLKGWGLVVSLMYQVRIPSEENSRISLKDKAMWITIDLFSFLVVSFLFECGAKVSM